MESFWTRVYKRADAVIAQRRAAEEAKLKSILSKKRYLRRVRNRNSLYIKRRALGRVR
ncbi:hypothetical protein [Clostridium intestinale]|uniref:Uncharacterized protein n=1 Tax=Clostridium intestinale TaxID=36845 RepID=A0A7D6ZUW3_9CLOT|nr:hypothetical protein [Clostridium intestinale]QLY77822.1 hypothetical protein HZF06_11940 [Clostridium intestinale]